MRRTISPRILLALSGEPIWIGPTRPPLRPRGVVWALGYTLDECVLPIVRRLAAVEMGGAGICTEAIELESE